MRRQLVLVHGRAQHGKDPDKLKEEWLQALSSGLAKNDPPLSPVAPSEVVLPFYGDTLEEMAIRGAAARDAADVTLRGDGEPNNEARRFMLEVLDEIRDEYGITDADVQQAAGERISERGPLNWTWIRAVLQALDAIPSLSAATIEQVTKDVYQYLTNATVRLKIDNGVATAITPGVRTVVVGHSLGSVVAYTLLLREGRSHGWTVPLLVTVGSPLAVNAIRSRAPGLAGVGGNRNPPCVSAWFNAMDLRDAVSLYPLDAQHFPLHPPDPPIENKTDVDNPTSNRHGITGYLADTVVAKRIHDALTQTAPDAPASQQ